MLTALRLGNFKAFADAQTVPIRPLTLVFGANSSGKSSLIHGILLARHAMQTGDLDVFKTEMGGESVDLGGFAQYVHRRNLETQVTLRFQVCVEGESKRLAELLNGAASFELELTFACEVDNFGKTIREGRPYVTTVAVHVDGAEILHISHRKPRSAGQTVELLQLLMAQPSLVTPGDDPFSPRYEFRIDRVNPEHPVVRRLVEALVLTSTTVNEVDGEDFALATEVLNELLPQLVIERTRLLPTRVIDAANQTAAHPKFAPISRGNRREDLRGALRLFLPRMLGELLQQVEVALTRALERLHYLGPLRSYPPRHMVAIEDRDRNWTAGGAFAWEVVRRREEVRNKVNEWLGSPERLQTPYALRVERFISPAQAESMLAENLYEAIEHAQVREIDYRLYDSEESARNLVTRLLAAPDLDRLEELVLVDKRTNTVLSHRDVGVGISQVLPVLVHAYANRGKLIAIEQPEIHLHPALQAELGDVLIHSALGERKNRFILETHSEHLILRILRRIRECSAGGAAHGGVVIRPDDVSVLFVQPGPKGSEVIEMPVTPDGDFDRPWPGGFFAERFQDLP